MRKIAAAVAMLAFLTGPAYSQFKKEATKTPRETQEEDEARRIKEIDRQYDAHVKRSRTTNPNVASDPWQNVRPPTPPSGKK